MIKTGNTHCELRAGGEACCLSLPCLLLVSVTCSWWHCLTVVASFWYFYVVRSTHYFPILFHGLLSRSYLYHCVWSWRTCRNSLQTTVSDNCRTHQSALGDVHWTVTPSADPIATVASYVVRIQWAATRYSTVDTLKRALYRWLNATPHWLLLFSNFLHLKCFSKH